MPIPLISNITAQNGGNFAMVKDSEVSGGFHVVEDITERDAIKTGVRTVGMHAYVRSTDLTYRLQSDLVTWVTSSISGGGADSTAFLSLSASYVTLSSSLVPRFETVSGSYRQLSASWSDLSSTFVPRIERLSGSFSDLSSSLVPRFETVSSSFGSLSASYVVLSSQFTSVSSSYAALSTSLVPRFEQLSGAFSNLSSSLVPRFETVSGSYRQLSASWSSFSSSWTPRIELLSGTFSDLSSSLVPRFETVSASFDSLSASYLVLSTQFTIVSSSHASLSTSLVPRFEQLSGAFSDLSSSLVPRFETVSGSYSQLSASWSSFSGNLSSRFETVSGTVATMKLWAALTASGNSQTNSTAVPARTQYIRVVSGSSGQAITLPLTASVGDTIYISNVAFVPSNASNAIAVYPSPGQKFRAHSVNGNASLYGYQMLMFVCMVGGAAAEWEYTNFPMAYTGFNQLTFNHYINFYGTLAVVNGVQHYAGDYQFFSSNGISWGGAVTGKIGFPANRTEALWIGDDGASDRYLRFVSTTGQQNIQLLKPTQVRQRLDRVTSTLILSGSDAGRSYNTSGSSADMDFVLIHPSASDGRFGETFKFRNMSSNYLRIKATGSAQIFIGNRSCVPNGFIRTNVTGSSIEIEREDPFTWYIVGMAGSWNDFDT